MRTIFVLFDTLNRRYLEPYGGALMLTPNFRRLAERSVTFDNHYVGSLPCMPARRDLMTGRLNFLHRSWGPMEPFDVAMPRCLRSSGVYSHLITDHYHYFEDGGAGYHTRYNSFEFVRGQEGDCWKAQVEPPLERWKQEFHPSQYNDTPGSNPYHYMVNRSYIRNDAEFPSARCFALAEEFLEENSRADNWFLQIETFDPHEPFHAPDRHRKNYPTKYEGPIRDWPPYGRVTEEEAEQDEMRANYMATLAACDELLGRLLDRMDALDMWKDTMLVVSTDHGYLLAEHDWWAKNRMPCYQEIANIPLFIHHPAHAERAGERCQALTQTPDLMPTFLQAFGADIPAEVTARSLMPLLAGTEASIHDNVIFGYYGGSVNLTDGRHVYFRYPDDVLGQELYQYTLMPNHMLQPFTMEELKGATLLHDLTFAGGVPVLRIPVLPTSPWYNSHGPRVMQDASSAIFDIKEDSEQKHPVHDPELEKRLEKALSRALAEHDAPPEVWRRLDLS